MLKVCQQSRLIALSVYEPRLKLYTSRENLGRELCAGPDTISRLGGHAFVYTRREHPPVNIQPDSEVHSVVAWENIPLGFMWTQTSLERISIKYFGDWPPDEDGVVMDLTFRKDRYCTSGSRTCYRGDCKIFTWSYRGCENGASRYCQVWIPQSCIIGVAKAVIVELDDRDTLNYQVFQLYQF